MSFLNYFLNTPSDDIVTEQMPYWERVKQLKPNFSPEGSYIECLESEGLDENLRKLLTWIEVDDPVIRKRRRAHVVSTSMFLLITLVLYFRPVLASLVF